MATVRRSTGVDRVLAKLRDSIDNQRYYESHQMYRTLYFRYLGQKRYDELIRLLSDGSLLLLKHDQKASGADLATLLVNVLTESKTEPNEELFVRLAELFKLMAADSPERTTFVASALRWSVSVKSSNGPESGGDPRLHLLVGRVLWQEKNYAEARLHLLRSADGRTCAEMLVEFHLRRGYPSEIDLFIAQAVLQLLCLREIVAANAALTSYTSRHPNIKKGNPPYFLPLLNFLWYLLQAIETGRLSAFTILVQQYQPSLRRDPSYMTYIERIGCIFFDVPPQRPNTSRPGGLMQGILGDLMQAFVSGADSDDSDSETVVPTCHSAALMDLRNEDELD